VTYYHWGLIMGKTVRSIAYWTTITVSLSFLVLAVYAFFERSHYAIPMSSLVENEAYEGEKATKGLVVLYAGVKELILVVAPVVTSMTALAGIFFGWRQDRRQARTLDIRTKELELKVLELQSKIGGPSS
jgi:hypothetical protein